MHGRLKCADRPKESCDMTGIGVAETLIDLPELKCILRSAIVTTKHARNVYVYMFDQLQNSPSDLLVVFVHLTARQCRNLSHFSAPCKIDFNPYKSSFI